MSRPFFLFFFLFFLFFRTSTRARFIIRPRELFVRLEKTCDASHWTPTLSTRSLPPPPRTGIYGRFAATAPLVPGPLSPPPFRPSLLIAFANSSGCVNYLYFLRSPTCRACNNAQFVITLCLSLSLSSRLSPRC